MDGSTSSEEEASSQSEFDSLDGQFSLENGDEDEDPASIRQSQEAAEEEERLEAIVALKLQTKTLKDYMLREGDKVYAPFPGHNPQRECKSIIKAASVIFNS